MLTSCNALIFTNFRCETPDQALPANKRLHEHQPVFWSKTPYVRVETRFGTDATTANRIGHHGYTGSAPEAPILLGTAQAAVYQQLSDKLVWGQFKGKAIAIGFGVGSVLGGVALGLIVGAFAIAKLLGAGIVFGNLWPVLAAYMLLGGIMMAAAEWRDCNVGKQRFDQMVKLCQGYASLERGERDQGLIRECQGLVHAAYEGKDWVMRQGALEYDARMQQAAPPQFSEAKAA